MKDLFKLKVVDTTDAEKAFDPTELPPAEKEYTAG